MSTTFDELETLTQEVVADGLEFPEGPAQGADGSFYVAEMRGARISQIDPTGDRRTLAPIDGSPGAVAIGPDRALYVTNNRGRTFVDGRPRGVEGAPPGSIDRVTPDGTVTTLYRECDGVGLNAPNDLSFDGRGGFYFTDPDNGNLFADDARWPVGHLYYATSDGRRIERVATGYELCNGLAVSDDGTRLFVCETLTSSVWVHDVGKDGALGPRRPFGHLPAGHQPDGCCLDTVGNLICAAVGSGALVVLSPDGALLARVPVDCKGVTNCAFGGPGNRFLYFTEGFTGRLSRLPWPCPGMVLHPDRPRSGAPEKGKTYG